jgi:hypothetical protein
VSVLNQASDGLFNVLIVLVRALVRLGPKPRDTLLRACGAGLDAVDPGHLGRTLIRWTELGLFGAEDDDVILREPHRSLLGKNVDVAEQRLPKIVRAIALAPENNMRFWEAEESKSADLTRGLAWMLAQDIYSLDTSDHAKLAELEGRQVADPAKRIIQNNTRWNGLRTWMLYLGFARGSAEMTVDPTGAVRNVLPEIFGQDQALPAPVFVERAAAVLPVLDGGAYRVQIEDVLKEAAWARPMDGLLSMSFSRAIQRLDREGAIAAEQKSDSEGGVTLTGSDQRQWRRMTHVRRLPTKKGQ